MRENEKEREELKASRPKTLLIKKSILITVLVWGFIAKPPLQNTKKTKSKSYYKGQIGKKQKKCNKKVKTSKSKKGEQWNEK